MPSTSQNPKASTDSSHQSSFSSGNANSADPRKRASVYSYSYGSGNQPQPVKEAVSSAFATSDVSNQVSPELVAHITEQVINNLKMSGIAPGPAPPPKASSNASSNSSAPPRDVYTPPSPDRDYDDSRDAPGTGMDGAWDRSRQPYKANERQRSTSPPPIAIRAANSRPPPPNRASTGDATTLEKIWQPLFDKEDNPTPRLGQLLRGLAIHIIEDYEPKQSIVIPPSKMLNFYEEMKISDEVYPWQSIFGGKMKDSSISHMYRDLACQHHFIQTKNTEKPTVPALTPAGFETWMTYVIRAHPDEEYERYAKAVLHMPISNADDLKERFPKELSRRLFPKAANERCLDLLDDSILADPVIETHEVKRKPRPQPTSTASQPAPSSVPSFVAQPTITRKVESTEKSTSVPPPPLAASRTNLAPGQMKQQAYSAPNSEAAVSEASDDETATAVRIERERKPYYAQPGGGKMYDNEATGGAKLAPRAQTMATSTRPTVTSDEALGRARAGSQATAGGYMRSERSPTGSRLQPVASYPRSDADVYGHPAAHHAEEEEEDQALRRTRSERSRRYQAPASHSSGASGAGKGYDEEHYRRGSTAGSGYSGSSYNNYPGSRY